MGLSFTWSGILTAKKSRLQKALLDQVPQTDPEVPPVENDVTESVVLSFIKNTLKERVIIYERAEAINKTQQDFNNNFINPL